jgi:alkanesulfonate monooxygenase SsuD/methylene tetrahydromethanopterin reductase-like flavin-dependent oxidoreductase (luciferase family)
MRFGVMFDFRNPDPWRKPDPAFYRAQLDEITRLDELGYDHVWLTEHHFVNDGYNPSVLPTAAAIAARTSRIRIGTFVLLMPFHDPVRVAEDAICVDILSGGRFDLGVGQGYRAEEFAAFNIPRRERSTRMAEGIDLIHRLFTEREVTFRANIRRSAG